MKLLYTLFFSFLLISNITEAQTKRGAVNFNGAGGVIEVPHNSKLDLGSGAFTIEAWIQASPNLKTVPTPAPIIICKKQEGTNSDGWMFGLADDGKLAVELKGNGYKLTGFGGGGGSGVAAIDLRDDQCHHVAMTREIGSGADTVRGYQDGQYIKRSKKTVSKVDVSTSDYITIGYSSFIPPAQYQFEGMIKEIRVWSTTRTETQINDNKTKWLKGNEPGLIAYWRINESEDNASTGTLVRDYVSNKNGTLKGAAIWDQYCNEMDPLPVGILKVAENNADIVVYPNPASQAINISGISNDAFEVNIFDMSARLMISQGLNTERSIDVSNLDTGAYLLLLKNNDGSVYRAAFNVK